MCICVCLQPCWKPWKHKSLHNHQFSHLGRRKIGDDSSSVGLGAAGGSVCRGRRGRRMVGGVAGIRAATATGSGAALDLRRRPQSGRPQSRPRPPAFAASSSGFLTCAPHVDYYDPLRWIRDPRLRSGEFAEQRGWWQCGCNGTCGRKSCPGRRRGYLKHCEEEAPSVGCPNPALSFEQQKPRCASCVCRASDCEQHCNITGFCRQHRLPKNPEEQVMKRPAAEMERPAAGVEQPAASIKQRFRIRT